MMFRLLYPDVISVPKHCVVNHDILYCVVTHEAHTTSPNIYIVQIIVIFPT